MAHPGGRPTKYNPDVIKKTLEKYLTTCGREQTKLPKLTEFYRLLAIDEDTGNAWQSKYPEFSVACKRITDAQKEELIDDGLFGGREVNPGMAIFLLKVNHGMVEKTNVDITTGGQPFFFARYETSKPVLPNPSTQDSGDSSS